MSEPAPPPTVTADAWPEGWPGQRTALRSLTSARLALGRSGASLPTREVLAFELAHAQARDAVHTPLDVPALRSALEAEGWNVVEVRSRAPNRAAYLARPDWGRRLHVESAQSLATLRQAEAPDLVLVLSDGLSSLALQSHAAAFLRSLRPAFIGLRIAPLVIATQARVALADEVGELLGARVAISLIGERPGLSAADSLGAYLTFGPKVGRNDAERNCISNIRPGGLSFEGAAAELAALVHAALKAGTSGVSLAFSAAQSTQLSTAKSTKEEEVLYRENAWSVIPQRKGNQPR